jgi:5-methylcytosine-specific restriction endonuclease McrA
MSKVFVLDTNHIPLQPCHPAKARLLLRDGHAAIFKRYPFTIILKRAVTDPAPAALRLKLDPGSQTTGLAIVSDTTGEVIWAAELHHRGRQIRAALSRRATLRRTRRQRKTRYRARRSRNRRRPPGWLPPSLASRVANIMTWVARLRRLCPIAAVSVELVCFDTRGRHNPENSGTETQRGEPVSGAGRIALREKRGRACAYCGKTNVPLQVEHIVPKARGGTNRVSNLTLACGPCNQAKGKRTAAEFGHPGVQAQVKGSLRDAAAINATRRVLSQCLVATGLPVEVGTGGRTKANRDRQGLPKTHWIDAACVGTSTPERLKLSGVRPLMIKATGHGWRQRCRPDQYGFPRCHAARAKSYLGFQTGDMVRAVIPVGRYAGTHVGRIAIRFAPKFLLKGFNVHPKYLRVVQRADGYDYQP